VSFWHSKSLGDGISAAIYTVEIERVFQTMFEAVGQPVEMAVFTRREEGSLHCEVLAYFSPAAADIARAFSAQPCEQPARQGLELLAGSSECWRVIFS
jgi:hypothetical protein